MVKGPARNAQFFFITEYVIPKYDFRSFHDALNTGRELWKGLSDLEKAPWKAKEQNWKAYMRGPAGDKYRKDCSGNNMQQEFDKQKDKEQFEEDVRTAAIEYVKPKPEVLEQPFYFISFEYALQDDYGNYYPCEVGLVKYSLKRGIEKNVHYFLKPGEYPLGTKAAAKKHSEERHKIPYLGFEKATDGYSAVFAHMRDVLLNTNSGASSGASGGYPPIYCMPADVEMNRKCLNVLFERAQRHESEQIKIVASASLLLIELFGSEICGEAKALEILSSTTFDHEKGVACDWHYEKECINCALATARKIVFALSDSLKTTYNLSLTSNHLPTVSQMPNLPAAVQLVPFEPPRTKNTFKSGASSVAGSAVSANGRFSGGDSVVSGYSSRVGARNQSPADNLANDFSQMGVGRGQGSSYAQSKNGSSRPAPPGQPLASNEVPFDDDEDEWQTVSTHRSHQGRNQQPAQQPSAWGRLPPAPAPAADNWGAAPAPAPAQAQASSAGWDYDDEDDEHLNQRQASAPQGNAWATRSTVSSGTSENRNAHPPAPYDEDWDDVDGVSVTSSTARAPGWGSTTSSNSVSNGVLSSNPYARTGSSVPGVGRGRGLSMSGR